jgi:hypothetical protein
MKYKINPVSNSLGSNSEIDNLINMLYKDFLADTGLTTQPGGSTPKQYGLPPGATELQDLIEYRQMPFSLGNIFKACYRMGVCDHSDNIRDINKIIWFAERIKAELTKK